MEETIKWFRVNHGVFADIIHFTEQPVNDEIWTDAFQFFINGEAFLSYFKTYEEAREACLEKLIELVTDGKR